MRSARWLGVAVIAAAVAACSEDVTVEDGSGGGGGSGPATSAVGPSVGSNDAAAPSSSATAGDGGSIDDGSVVTVGSGGSGDGGAGGGDPYVAPDGALEACEGYWAPMVDLLLECFGTTGEYFYGAPDAVDRLADNCSRVAFRGGLTIAEQELCNADIEAISSCEELNAYFNRGTDACTATVVGDHEVGEPCITPYECATSACYIAPGESCGTCRPVGGEGEACDGSVTLCGPYLDCVDGTCIYPPVEGDPCGAETVCASGLSCVDGECGPPIAEGDPCDVNADTYECATGTYCNFATEVCDVMPAGELDGECGILDDGRLGLCEAGLRCRLDPSYHGTCIEPTADGDTCAPNAPILFTDECATPASCIDFECAMRPDAFSCP